MNALRLKRSDAGAMETILSGIEYLPDGPLTAAAFGNGLAEATMPNTALPV